MSTGSTFNTLHAIEGRKLENFEKITRGTGQAKSYKK